MITNLKADFIARQARRLERVEKYTGLKIHTNPFWEWFTLYPKRVMRTYKYKGNFEKLSLRTRNSILRYLVKDLGFKLSLGDTPTDGQLAVVLMSGKIPRIGVKGMWEINNLLMGGDQ
jgi:hypothetical protein